MPPPPEFCPYFWGQEPVPSTEGATDQWLFQVEGALATHMEEVVRSAVIGLVRGAAHELFRVHWLWGRNECHTEAHKRMQFGHGPSKAKLQKEFFLMEQRKMESIKSVFRKSRTTI